MESEEKEELKEWVVRFVHRNGNENRFYFFDHHGNINARVTSSMRMTKEVAVQFAKAINDNSNEWKARAFRYETSKAQKEQQIAANRKPDSLKSEEQVELEELRRENAALKVLVQTQVEAEKKSQSANYEMNCETKTETNNEMKKENENGSEESPVEVQETLPRRSIAEIRKAGRLGNGCVLSGDGDDPSEGQVSVQDRTGGGNP